MVLDLLNGLVADGGILPLLLTDFRASRWLTQVPSGVQTIHLNQSAGYLSRVRGISRAVRETGAGILMSHLIHANIQSLLARRIFGFPKGTRIVGIEHSIASSYLASRHTMKHLFLRVMTSLFYKELDRVVCVSEAAREDLVKKGWARPERAFAIYNPVDVQRIKALAQEPLPGPIEEAAAGRTVLCCVGRLSHEKNQRLLLGAMRFVAARRPKILLLLVGDGPERADLEAFTESEGLRGHVVFAGVQDNPYPFMQRAEMLVLPSHFEGLGLVMLEALALGRKVVVCDTLAAREVLGEGPHLCAPTEEKMAYAILRVLEEPRATNPDRILVNFDKDTVCRQYRDLLLAVMGRPSGPAA